MARRRRKGGKKGKKTIPLAIAIPALYPALRAYNDSGMTKELPVSLCYYYTGYHPRNNTFSFDAVKPLLIGMVAGTVAHKVANRVGVNRIVKKATFGWVSI